MDLHSHLEDESDELSSIDLEESVFGETLEKSGSEVSENSGSDAGEDAE
jgi:hypothetical protein